MAEMPNPDSDLRDLIQQEVETLKADLAEAK